MYWLGKQFQPLCRLTNISTCVVHTIVIGVNGTPPPPPPPLLTEQIELRSPSNASRPSLFVVQLHQLNIDTTSVAGCVSDIDGISWILIADCENYYTQWVEYVRQLAMGRPSSLYI